MSGGKAPRLLIISPNWIGDAVMAQPLLQLLRQQQPEAAIDVLAPGWVAPVWRAMAETDTVIEAPFRHGALQLRERWAFAQQLRRRGYSAAYVLPNTLKFALIPWLAGIPKRVGYRGEMRYGLLNAVHRDERRPKRPMVSFYAALAEPPIAVAPRPDALPRPALVASAAQQTHALEHAGLDAARPLLVFAPGAEFGSAKRWPAAHFAELANTVLAKGGIVRGVIPKVLVDWEHQHDEISELFVVDDMHVRKRKLYDLCDGAIILPGGFGTLDELFEILTWNQLSIHNKKIFILNSGGFYNHLLAHVRLISDEGFMYGPPEEKFIVLNEPADLLPHLGS